MEWCKKRALEYVDMGDVEGAFSSFTSDLSKHPETEKHSGVTLGVMMLMNGHLSTPDKMLKFIQGFH